MKKILVISPHPDDEAIGCGGTLSKHIAEGDIVEVIFLTSGEKGGHGKSEVATAVLREEEAQNAAETLKLSKIHFWRQSDGLFKATPENIEKLKTKIVEFKPDYIYTPHGNEQHPDHHQAALLAQKAISGLSGNVIKPILFMYEVWTPIQTMDHIVDITPFVDEKRKAILAYRSQCEVLKFDEAIIGLNRYRGEMHSWPGGEYAEVFIQINFEEKQDVFIDTLKNTVTLQYDENSKLYKNQKKLYSQISHIKYVPKMSFKSGKIILNYCGETLFEIWNQNQNFGNEEKKAIKNQLIKFINNLFESQIAHRDLHIGNICWDGNQIWIIDWEYACTNAVNKITEHYDLTGSGLESPSETYHVHIFKQSFQYNCINDLIKPLSISLADFK